MKKNQDYFLGVIMALAAALLWSILPIMLKIAAKHCSADLIVFSRFSVAAIVLYIYLVVTRRKLLHVPNNIPLTIVAAIALSLNYLTYTLGVKYSGAANAGILIQSGSVYLTIFGIFLFKERLNWRQVVGVFLAFFGFLLFFYEKIQFSSDLQSHYYGTVVTLFSGFVWSVYAVMAKLDKQNSSDSAFNLWVFLFG
nr:DMT family transporter [Pseudomonadota bacterium]